VQQAGRKLEHDGILVALPNGGYVIRRLDAVYLRQIYQCRAALEGLAAGEAALRISADQIEQLARHTVTGEAALDRQAYRDVAESNSAFHKIVIDASGNSVLEKLVGSVQRLILFYRLFLLNASLSTDGAIASYAKHLRATLSSHQALVGAFRAGDAEAAAALMRDHILATGRDMEVILVLVESGRGTPGPP